MKSKNLLNDNSDLKTIDKNKEELNDLYLSYKRKMFASNSIRTENGNTNEFIENSSGVNKKNDFRYYKYTEEYNNKKSIFDKMDFSEDDKTKKENEFDGKNNKDFRFI